MAQNSDTASHLGIIVIPCSSRRRNGEHDVEIPINHLLVDDFTYAKCQSIMNVDPRTLIRYVCTIPEEAMATIDGEIIRMFTSLANVFSESELKIHGINVVNNSIGKYSCGNTATECPDDDEIDDTDSQDEDLKPEDTRFSASDKKMIDVVTLALVSGKLSYNAIISAKIGVGQKGAKEYINKLIEMGFLIPHKNPKLKRPLEINMDVADKVLSSLGIEPVKSSSANEQDSPEQSDDYRQKFAEVMTPESIIKGVSAIAKLIENNLRLNHLGEMRSNPNMECEEFCRTIGSIIYYSILQSMGITIHGKKIIMPSSNVSFGGDDVWEFFNVSGHTVKLDNWLRHYNGCIKHGIPVAFPPKFMETLDNKLRRSSIISNQKAEEVCDLVKEKFLTPVE